MGVKMKLQTTPSTIHLDIDRLIPHCSECEGVNLDVDTGRCYNCDREEFSSPPYYEEEEVN